jgi:hypothetical protein
MFSFPNPKTTEPSDQRIQRILEIIPGFLTWLTIILMLVLSFLEPIWVAVFIIMFDIYWIFRTIFITYFSIIAYHRFRDGKMVNWWERCQNIENPKEYLKIIAEKISAYKKSLEEISSFSERKKMKKEIKMLEEYKKDVQQIADSGRKIWDWRKIIHVVMLPTANEGAEIIEPAIQAIADSNFPNSQIIILLATEEREDPGSRLAKVNYLQEKFKGVFREFVVTVHEVAEGEMKCKASNATYAAKKIQAYFDEHGIDYKRVIFSNFDCDSVCHPQYFANLTYEYITSPDRLRLAYQPLPMYHNNLWDTNACVRVIVTSSSFWHMFQSTRSEMVTFASHSEPFDTLVKVGFWPVNIINEDSIIYWKCFSYFHGNYRVRPIYLPVSLDAVLAETFWKTIKNQYKQKRRWAYGIEHFPTVMRALWPDKKVSLKVKIRAGLEMIEGHHSWATSAFILALLGWLPLIFGGPVFNQSVIAHNLPLVTRYLMTLATGGLVISMFLSFFLLPPRPAKYSKKRYIYMFLQWFLAPIIAPTLGAIPAIDSQTRLMTKRYFGEFWVTEKMKKN